MVKCPFCGFGNEDGALFCEQCKSDISNVAPAPHAAARVAADADSRIDSAGRNPDGGD